ncbi:MAG: 3-phosphoshikimate 1-carboxyvinyltransferase [Opitutaceae bacterium]
MKLVVHPARGTLRGALRVPISKYHLHRALIFGSLAEGTTVIHGRSDCGHIGDTLRALRDFGVNVQPTEDGYRLRGGPYRPRNGRIRVGSSGSTLQFMLGLGCRSSGSASTYDGHHLLRKRPIGPLLDALTQAGIAWESDDHCLPVKILPGRPAGGRIRIAGTLSQWISGLLMLAPFAARRTTIEVVPPFNERNYVALTLAMMRRFGIRVGGSSREGRWTVPPGQRYRACEIDLDADLSSAAFLLGLAALHPTDLTLTGIRSGKEHPEGGIPAILAAMGLPLRFDGARRTLRIRHSGIRLKSISVDMRTLPDFLPMMAVLGAAAEGRTVLRNIGPGRMKESNRVRAMLQLRRMGARLEERGENLVIEGGQPLAGASVSSFNDHRVEMALAVAATAARGPTEITYPNAFRISYPEFLDHLRTLGVRAEIR